MAKKTVAKWCWLVAALLASGCGTCEQPADQADIEKVPQKAEDVQPLLIGKALPKMMVRTGENEPFDLNAAVAEKPVVLIFYRGGWCPYCNKHLGQLQAIEGQLVEMGYQIIAVSPDRPEKIKAAVDKHGLKYPLVSDSEMGAAKAMGVAFRLDDATVSKYKTEYGIDIEADSGQKHHLLLAPSVFLVGTDGVVQFSYVNPNYEVRIDPAVLLEAAKAARRSELKKDGKG